MSKNEVMAWALLIGSLVSFFAVIASIAWHQLDKSLGEIEPVEGEDFADTDKRWNSRRKLRDVVRAFGLACLYGGLLLMGFGGIGLALVTLEAAP
jgi:hypothetical protein